MVDTWLERVQALQETVSEQRGYHSSTTSKASPSARPMPPWAKPQSPRVPPPPSTPDVPSPPPIRSSHRRRSEPSPAVAARHNGDSSSDEPLTPSESPAPVTPLPLAGTIIAVAAKAAPPAIKAPTEAIGPAARAAPVSETTVEVPCYAAAETVVEALGFSNTFLTKKESRQSWPRRCRSFGGRCTERAGSGQSESPHRLEQQNHTHLRRPDMYRWIPVPGTRRSSIARTGLDLSRGS